MPGSAGPTAASTGVMPDQILGGPLWWYFFGVYVLALALAVYVSIDSRRRIRAEALAVLPEPAWLYDVFQPVFLLCAVAVWLPFLPRVLAVVPVVLVPFALASQVAYLLRVVFPKAPATSDAESPPADEIDGEEA